MGTIQSLLQNWIDAEPVASLWLGITAAILLGVTFARPQGQENWPRSWGGRLIVSFAQALGFVALVGMFAFVLSSAYDHYNRIYGCFCVGDSLTNQGWQRQEKRYGNELKQYDLNVTLLTTGQTQEAVQAGTLQQVNALDEVGAEQPIMRNSIKSFRGKVNVHAIDSAQSTERYNAYELSALYEYEVVNTADEEMRAEFRFPLSEGTRKYDDVRVKVDGNEIASYQVISGTITWGQILGPGEDILISIQYAATGMDWFHYEITEQREVSDFVLELTVDTQDSHAFTTPDNGSIQLDIQNEPDRKIVIWTIDHAIVSPRLSLNLNHWSYAPYHAMIASLPYAQRGLMLSFSLMMLTFFVCRAVISLRQVALLACLFVLPYLLLMSGVVPVPSSVALDKLADYQIHLLPVLALFSLILALITLRGQKRLPVVLVLLILALFMAGYPFVGLVSDEKKRNMYEGIIQAAMLAYLFLLTLLLRIREIRQPPATKSA